MKKAENAVFSYPIFTLARNKNRGKDSLGSLQRPQFPNFSCLSALRLRAIKESAHKNVYCKHGSLGDAPLTQG